MNSGGAQMAVLVVDDDHSGRQFEQVFRPATVHHSMGFLMADGKDGTAVVGHDGACACVCDKASRLQLQFVQR
jgi:hypothetical protein